MDIAKAFKVILLNDFTGTINISSGNSISLKDIAQYILKKLKKEKLLELNPHSKDQRKVYGNNNMDILFKDILKKYIGDDKKVLLKTVIS